MHTHDKHLNNLQLTQVNNLIENIKARFEILGDSQSVEILESIRNELRELKR